MGVRDFIELLRREGELVEITAEVDPYLEISEIADRAVKAHGPALLFTHPKGHRLPVLMNQFGTARRMELALGAPLDDIAARIGGLLDLQLPQGLVGKVKALGQLRELASFAPKVVRGGSFREVVVEPPDLGRLPVLTSWPGDGGPFITLPIVITKDRTGRRNAGMYRLQVFDGQSTGMHWHVHHDGAANFRESDGRLEVAVALGTDPAVTYAATAPLPPGIDEFMFAGFLRGEPVELARCATVDLEVPADAEIVLEGYVQRGEERDEGPFGDHTGYYSLDDAYPVFHVTCVTERKKPIYAATIVGPPPMEDYFMGKAIERIFLPLMRLQLPEIRDVSMPAEGIFHNLMLVAIRKSYLGHARKVMHAIWGMGQAMFTKCIVVVDEDCDVQDVGEVVLRVTNNIDPERDIQFTFGPVDSLDHSSRLPDYGSKMGVDATRKWPEEGFTRPWPDEIVMDPLIATALNARTRADVDRLEAELVKHFGRKQSRYLGDNEANWSSVASGVDPRAVIFERVTNMWDAVIEAEALRCGKTSFPDPAAAARDLLSVPKGGLTELALGERRTLAERCVFSLLDSSDSVRRPTIASRDKGIGLTTIEVPRTILSLERSNKLRKPYLHGVFGKGGSVACLFSEATIIVVAGRMAPKNSPFGPVTLRARTVVHWPVMRLCTGSTSNSCE